MKQFLITVFLLFVSGAIFAQDIIIKNDGDEIKSKVVEITLETIKYKLFNKPSGPLRNVSKNEVFMIIYEDGTREKITAVKQTKHVPDVAEEQETIPKKIDEQKPQTKRSHKGGSNIETGIMTGDLDGLLSINYIYDFMLGKNVSLGIGTGILVDPEYTEDPFLPIFLDTKAYFLQQINSPFGYFDIGAALPLNHGTSYMLIETGLGYNFQIGSRNGMAVSLGYHHGSMPLEDEDEAVTFSGLALRLSFKF